MSASRSLVTQELSTAYVREIFKNLESGDGKGFFDHVLDGVDWIVEGTHPLAGHYHSKAEFLAHTFEKLAKVLPHGAQLNTEHVLVSGDWAVVELHSLATAKNGLRFDNRYCWVCRFAGGERASTSVSGFGSRGSALSGEPNSKPRQPNN